MGKHKEVRPLEDLPFKGLEKEAMIALEEAGHQITVFATYSKKKKKFVGRKYYLNRDALAFVTGRAQSTIDKWVVKGWLTPAQKHGTYSLFLFEDVHRLLKTGRFPGAKVEAMDAYLDAVAIDGEFDPMADIPADSEHRAKSAIPVKPKKRTA